MYIPIYPYFPINLLPFPGFILGAEVWTLIFTNAPYMELETFRILEQKFIYNFRILQEHLTDFMRNAHPGIFIVFIILKRFDHLSYLLLLTKFYLCLILPLYTKGLFVLFILVYETCCKKMYSH